jgi:hypothetical protein
MKSEKGDRNKAEGERLKKKGRKGEECFCG